MSNELAKFEGMWKFNQRNGPGKMVWPDGSKYEGEWVNDQRTFGKLLMVDQNVYEGNFKDEKFHGKGKLTLIRDDMVVECIFKNGFASHIGRAKYRDGSEYIGEMEDMKKHGIGIFIDNQGKRYEGEFDFDSAQGMAKIIYPDGSYYMGNSLKMMR
jgi:hypothetical protein